MTKRRIPTLKEAGAAREIVLGALEADEALKDLDPRLVASALIVVACEVSLGMAVNVEVLKEAFSATLDQLTGISAKATVIGRKGDA